MFLKIFSPIQKGLSKILNHQEIKTDNVLFRLHCVLTVAFLVASSVMLTTTQLVGKPIECLTSTSERTKDWAKAIETWCWVNSTFTMPVEIHKQTYDSDKMLTYLNHQSDAIQSSLFSQKRSQNTHREVGKHMSYPGVMNEYAAEEAPKRFYTYYQWVCFVLFFQGLLCYLPKALWDTFEDGLLSKLTTGLHGVCPTEEREIRTENIISYLLRYRKQHQWYALVYWGCEALCLVNLLLQMWLMNSFLGGYFFSYGLQALQCSEMPQYERNDPLIYIFPRITKCTFYYIGPSGSEVNLDSLCILPQNVINEKIYIFLWFWYIMLASLFVIVLIYRAILIVMPSFRPRLLAGRSRTVSKADAADLSSRLDLGDWWLLYRLAKNIDPLAFRVLVTGFIKAEKKNCLLDN